MVIDFLYKTLVVAFWRPFSKKKMPKDLSMSPAAVRARSRRNEERESNRYNQTLREYITYKYSNILDEFEPFYEQLRTKYPRRRFYAGTKEFRRWRREMITESFKEVGDEAAVSDVQEQQQQQQQQQQDEQQQQIDDQEEEHGDDDQQQQQQCDEQQQQIDDQEEEQNGQHGDEPNNEIDQMIAELENAGVQLHTIDEGIELDIYEELQADIEEFDYRLEVELEQY